MAAFKFALRRVSSVSPVSLQRWASAAAVPLTEPIEGISPPAGTRKTPEDVKVTKLGNGITVASRENHSSISNVAVLVKAGSRYENYSQRGLTHFLRKCAFLATEDKTAFKVAREIDLLGGTFQVTSTRENVMYSSEFLRDYLAPTVDTLGSIVTSPKFQSWEVNDQKQGVQDDVAVAMNQPSQVVLEELHRLAYRNALSNPLYCPLDNLSKFSGDDLKTYVDDWFIGKRMAIVGVGVAHDELVRCAETSFGKVPEGLLTPDEQSEYVGSSEGRLDSGSSLTHAAIVCKGASLTGAQSDLIAAGVLQHILGATPQGCVKWGSNSAGARLSKAASLAVDTPFSVAALNVSYSDSGLFGFFTVSDGNSSGKLLKGVMKEFNEVAKGSISDDDLTRAKNQLKSSYLMSTETQSTFLEDLGSQTALKGSHTPLSETLQQVDAITKDDVVKFARTVFSTRPTFVAHGNLSSTPRLDHLLSDISLK